MVFVSHRKIIYIYTSLIKRSFSFNILYSISGKEIFSFLTSILLPSYGFSNISNLLLLYSMVSIISSRTIMINFFR